MNRSRKKPYISTTCIGLQPGIQNEWKTHYTRKIRRIGVNEELPGSRFKQQESGCWHVPIDGSFFDDDNPR